MILLSKDINLAQNYVQVIPITTKIDGETLVMHCIKEGTDDYTNLTANVVEKGRYWAKIAFELPKGFLTGEWVANLYDGDRLVSQNLMRVMAYNGEQTEYRPTTNIKEYNRYRELDYFYVQNIGATACDVQMINDTATPYNTTIYCSTDSYEWTEWWTITNGGISPAKTLQPNEKLYLKAETDSYVASAGRRTRFISSAGSRTAVGGNIMSLLKGDEFATADTLTGNYTFYGLFYNWTALEKADKLKLPATTLADYCYFYMFRGCTALTAAPALPATTLVTYCYNGMFYGCTSLTTAPELPATTLASDCYNRMFQGCTALTTAPELPATTPADHGYTAMFKGCTSLTAAPELPATTLVTYCYSGMFDGCTSLTEAPELPATTLANNCYINMFNGCTALTEAPELPATTLAEYCYSAMFNGCTALTEAPELPATRLARYCYYQMFQGCTNLSSVEVAATTWVASYASYWLSGVSATGTFTKPAATLISSGANGIPTGWEVINK